MTFTEMPCTYRGARRPLSVELVGPAGSGKSTLRKLLCRDNEAWVEATFPSSLSCLRQLPWVLANGLPFSASRLVQWDDMRSMLYLQAWLRSRPTKCEVVAFDQGPVFRLAMLRESAPDVLCRARFQHWQRRIIDAWSRALDLIVCLDAPNSELERRIRQREKPHRCKSLSTESVQDLLDRHRSAHEETLSCMKSMGNPPVVRIASDMRSPQEAVLIVRQQVARINSEFKHGTTELTRVSGA